MIFSRVCWRWWVLGGWLDGTCCELVLGIWWCLAGSLNSITEVSLKIFGSPILNTISCSKIGHLWKLRRLLRWVW